MKAALRFITGGLMAAVLLLIVLAVAVQLSGCDFPPPPAPAALCVKLHTGMALWHGYPVRIVEVYRNEVRITSARDVWGDVPCDEVHQ